MAIYFISRHQGAAEWFASKRIPVDKTMAHIDPERVQPGDIVIGSLPVHLAAAVCQRGGRYFHLAIDLPEDARGRELSAEEMERFGARVFEYHIEQTGAESPDN